MTKPALFLLLLLTSLNLSGQSAISGKISSNNDDGNQFFASLIRQQKNYLEGLYYKSVTVPNELINGKEYIPYFFKSGTNPLLRVNMTRKAILFFREMQFKNIYLQYDTYRDEVIITDYSRTTDGRYAQIALNRDNIKGFNLYFDYDSLLFRYFNFPSEYSEKMKDGFYEVCYEGKFTFLVRHRSTVYNKEGVDKYEYKPEKYIFNGSEWARVTTNGSFLRLFGKQEKEISTLMHKSKIKVQRATSSQIAEILRYYDTLEKPGVQPN